MSYDLYLLRTETIGDDPVAAYERLEDRDDRAPEPDDEERLRALAADLRAASPGLDLSEPEVGFGLQLGYDAERAVVIDIWGVDGISMSWSYGADRAQAALEEVGLYLPVFERHGYVAYDPQLERLFNPATDEQDALAVHEDVHSRLGEIVAASAVERPWWRRLFGQR